jgi:hypothetical protein
MVNFRKYNNNLEEDENAKINDGYFIALDPKFKEKWDIKNEHEKYFTLRLLKKSVKETEDKISFEVLFNAIEDLNKRIAKLERLISKPKN